MAFNYLVPTHSIFGIDAQKELVENLFKKGVKKILVVTDKFLHEKTDFINQLKELCEKKGISISVFDNIQPNPTTKNVDDGLAALNESQADFVIAYGGGSPSDTAKLICLLKTNGGKVADYWGVNLSKKPAFPLAVINTTAGTATEVTQNAVITNLENHTKMVIVDQHIIPLIAVNNPEITVSLPKNMTAYTGMDALTHAIESYINHNNILLTDRLAALAISLVNENLEKAYNTPNDLIARENMMYGEYIAGMAFNSVGLGLVHAMSHPLSAVYGIAHGLGNAILLPHILKMNLEYDNKKALDLAKILGNTTVIDVKAAIDFCFNRILTLNKNLGIPSNLSDILKEDDLDTLAYQAKNDLCEPGNPKILTIEEIKNLYIEIKNYQE